MEEAQYIFDKYKTQCNPKNKRLLFIADECVFDDKKMHGGYVCNSSGQWNTTCKPSYCDNGYIYDKKTNKCIENICQKKDQYVPDDKENSKEGIACFIASMVFFGLSLITLITYIICCCSGWDKSIYIFFIMIPFLITAIILIMVSTLKYEFSL